MSKKANRLARESSPYLLQHAHNPVDWFPWGEEALERARSENKPVFLSIGYSACHWCHVMEQESFQDDAIAAQLNADFVSVKVDREERPDLDDLYMTATVALSGHGGWPMSVFLTPEGEPFFAGTYFPARDTGGRPGLSSLLDRITQMWKGERDTLLDQAKKLTEHVRQSQASSPSSGLSENAIRAACRSLEQSFDAAFGGFGAAPKFPAPHALSLLLRAHRRTQDAELLQMATRTLDGMLSGGLFDQLGGGFFRYSVDRTWLVPHFEKMLYDSAQLADVYTEAFQVTGASSYRRAVRQTLDFVMRQMQAPSGGYFSSCDADSEGEEGKYYVFTRDEVSRVVGEPAATHFCAFYGITDEGNFEGKNVLSAGRTLAAVAKEFGIDPGQLVESLESGREKLLVYQSARIFPDVDDKVIASWNGLMIRAMAHAGRAFGDATYIESAERAVDFIFSSEEAGGKMERPDGGLFRTHRAGNSYQPAFLEDYVFVADGLLALYEASGREEHLARSEKLIERVLADFSADDGTLYTTPKDGEPLIAKPRSASDSALPNANAVACCVLFRLSAYLDRPSYRARSQQIVQAFAGAIKRTPRAHAGMLSALDLLLEGPTEIVLSGAENDESFNEMAGLLGGRYLPTRVETRLTKEPTSPTPLTRNRFSNGTAARAFVCRDFVCEKPAHTAEELSLILDQTEASLVQKRPRELGSAAAAGRATSEATFALDGRRKHPERFNQLDGLWVSRLGLGSHRIGLDHPDHREAVRRALLSGINLLDTSPTFAFGDSERLVGEVLFELLSEEKLRREEIVIASKVGVFVGADGEELHRLDQRSSLVHVCPLNTKKETKEPLDLKSGAFCLDPRALEDQITRSLERLQLEHLDICLVQSPEHLLAAGGSRSELDQALQDAFTHLEHEVSRGRIGRYGVLSNTAGNERDDPLFVDLTKLVALAEAAGNKSHHFRVVELPLNVATPQAFSTDPPLGVVAIAKSLGLGILACRPLSPILGGALLRLVDPPAAREDDSSATLKTARYTVASLEAEFETTFAAQLRLSKKAPEGPILPLSGALGQALEQTATRQQFDLAETTLVTPRLRSLLAGLDRAFSGDQKWVRFKEKYVRAVGIWLAAVREVATAKNRQLLSELKDRLSNADGDQSSLESTGDEAPWLERALGSQLQETSVTSSFVGLRNPEQVDQALAVLAAASVTGSSSK